MSVATEALRAALADVPCIHPEGQPGKHDAADCTTRVRKHPECVAEAVEKAVAVSSGFILSTYREALLDVLEIAQTGYVCNLDRAVIDRVREVLDV